MHSLTVINTHDRNIKNQIIKAQSTIVLDVDFMVKSDYKLGVFVPTKYSLFDGSCYKCEIDGVEYIDIRLLLQRVMSGDIRLIVAICKYVEDSVGNTKSESGKPINVMLYQIYDNATCFIKAYLDAVINNIMSTMSSYLFDKKKYKKNTISELYNILHSLSNDTLDLEKLYSSEFTHYEYMVRCGKIKLEDVNNMYSSIDTQKYKNIIRNSIDTLVTTILLYAV
ncbi:MAG: hypothetical protein ACRCXT_07085 [Paraclostridium sp.]